MTDHSIIAPSAAHRWVNCTGSAMLSRLLPERESGVAADLGTQLHKAAASGNLAGLSPTHVKWIEAYRSLIPNTADQESRIGGEHSNVHVMHFGTVDAWWDDAPPVGEKGVLSILDAKFGKWEVSPVENWQLIGYAVEHCPEVYYHTIKLGIFQPQISLKPKWWVLSAEQFTPYAERYIAAAHAAFDNPTFTPGDWCQFCPAKGKVCDAVRGCNAPSAKEW